MDYLLTNELEYYKEQLVLSNKRNDKLKFNAIVSFLNFSLASGNFLIAFEYVLDEFTIDKIALFSLLVLFSSCFLQFGIDSLLQKYFNELDIEEAKEYIKSHSDNVKIRKK